jgi:hypothetical protein
MSRLPRLAFALLVATLAGACDDDGSGSTDAAADARRDGSSGCTLADCQGIPKPPVACMPPTVAEFTCVRSFDLRCGWGQERCAPGADAGTEAGTDATSIPGDAATDSADDAPAGS